MGQGISYGQAISLILMAFKLAGILDISWFFVFLPIWMEYIALVIVDRID